MRRGHAFTLVELLVVIGIIAVLVGMLLPALNRARYQANVTKCAAQMRGILQGIVMYCNDNKGLFPPARGDNGSPTYEPLVQYVFNIQQTNYPWDDPREEGAYLGRLIKRKYLSNVEGSYRCPSALSGTEGSADPERQNYYFNVHRKFVETPGFHPVWWEKIANFGKVPSDVIPIFRPIPYSITATGRLPSFRRALLTDAIWDVAASTHYLRGKRLWNLGFADGSVRTYTTDRDAERATGGWERLQDLSNAIQYAADGGTVDWNNWGTWTNKFNWEPRFAQ